MLASKRFKFFFLLLLLFGLGALSKPWKFLPTSIFTKKEEIALSKSESSVDISKKSRIVKGIGYVEPISDILRLNFRVEGIVKDVLVEVGQTVSLGTPLMVLANDDKQAYLSAQRRNLERNIAEQNKMLSGANPNAIISAEKRRDSILADLNKARREYERFKEIYEKGAISANQLDIVQTEFQQKSEELLVAEADLAELKTIVRSEDEELANAMVEVAISQVKIAETELEKTSLRAPVSGTVLEILKRQGERVGPLEPEPAILFADVSRLRVRAEIDENFATQLKKGQQASIFIRGLDEQSTTGEIVLVKKVMGPKTVFSGSATERKDLDVLQVLVDLPQDFYAPIGLEVEVEIELFHE